MNRRQAVKFRPAVQAVQEQQETKVFAKNEAEDFEDFSTKPRPRAGDRLKAIARVAEAGSLLCHGKTRCDTLEKPAFQAKNTYHCQGCNCHNSAPLCKREQERRTTKSTKHDEEEEDENDDLDNIIAKLRTGSFRPLRR